ncbi:MAG: ubiquinol-cytochrome c reductase iron-sulfur subunit [Desulfurivibrionaceae bacterium]
MGKECEKYRPPASARRRFLVRLTQAMLGLLALFFGALSLAFLLPRKAKKMEPLLVEVFKEEELPGQGVKRVDLLVPAAVGQRPVSHRVFVVKKQARLFALSARCTHLGCLVEWSRHRQRFVCPCHGGMYDDEGRVAQGPPPTPLVRLPVFVRDGRVYLELDG